MKKFKLVLLSLSVGLLANCVLLAGPQEKVEVKQKISMEVITGVKAPSANEFSILRVEEQKHPNLAKAMMEIKFAIKALNDAPDNFGGHKKKPLWTWKNRMSLCGKRSIFACWKTPNNTGVIPFD